MPDLDVGQLLDVLLLITISFQGHRGLELKFRISPKKSAPYYKVATRLGKPCLGFVIFEIFQKWDPQARVA